MQDTVPDDPTPGEGKAAASRFISLIDLGLSHDFDDETVRPEGWAPAAGQWVGRYRLIRLMGEGGFGLVWQAELSDEIRKEVALKLIKPGMDSRQVIARFEAERQTLALMDHPNIAAVLDAGATPQGRPFFVMELVRGSPITTFCDERRFTIRQRLELFVDVCNAVQHAHQKAILHRDLKPSNILVEEVDKAPVPKVIDFGIAKALSAGAPLGANRHSFFTSAGTIVGTPEYMSPEQAESQSEVDACSDIYSLGAILYELLTGIIPLPELRNRKLALEKMLQHIRMTEPMRPGAAVAAVAAAKPKTAERIAFRRCTDARRLVQTLRGDIGWIILKSLEKDRARRYESAAAFAADIQRYLRDEPISARSPTAFYLAQKLFRRKKAVFVGAIMVSIALLVGAAAAGYSYLQMRAALRKSQNAENFLANIFHEITLRNNNTGLDSGLSADAIRGLLEAADNQRRNELQDDPETDLRVAVILGQAYSELDDRDLLNAGRLYETALNRFQQLGLDRSPEAADCRFWMAWTDHRRKEERPFVQLNFDDEHLVRQCLAIRQDSPDFTDELYLQTEALLAGILLQRGQPGDTEAARAILVAASSGLSADHRKKLPAWGWILREQALLLAKEQHFADALATLEKASSILGAAENASPNRKSQAVADILRIQRRIYLQTDAFEKAEDVAGEERELRKKWLGYDDPTILIALSEIQLQLNKLDEAYRSVILAVSKSKQFTWNHTLEDALRLRLKVDVAKGRSATERLPDATELAENLLFSADRSRQTVETGEAGQTYQKRLSDIEDALRVDDLPAMPFLAEGPYFAACAALAYRRADFDNAMADMDKSLLADPANQCLYRYQKSLFALALDRHDAYAAERDWLLKDLRPKEKASAQEGVEDPSDDTEEQRGNRPSFREFCLISRAVLLDPHLTKDALESIQIALRSENFRVNYDDEAQDGWLKVLFALAGYRAGYANGALDDLKPSMDPVLEVQTKIVRALVDSLSPAVNAKDTLDQAEISLHERLINARESESGPSLDDILSTNLLMKFAREAIEGSGAGSTPPRDGAKD